MTYFEEFFFREKVDLTCADGRWLCFSLSYTHPLSLLLSIALFTARVGTKTVGTAVTRGAEEEGTTATTTTETTGTDRTTGTETAEEGVAVGVEEEEEVMAVAGAAAVEAAPKKRRDAGLDKKMRGVVKGGLGRCPPVSKKERPHRTGKF
jgi:hypothetical protein